MTLLSIDTENTTHNKGSPFDQRNYNVCISYSTGTTSGCTFSDDRAGREHFERLLQQSTTLVFFNAKYDLHWLRKLGIAFNGKRVWCCQAAEFVLGRQLSPYPDLDRTGVHYDLGNKISVEAEPTNETIAELYARGATVNEYWAAGHQTDEIPRDVLERYAIRDADLTFQIFGKQQERIKETQKVLLSLVMQDLLVLQEMEWNGMAFDKELSLRMAKEVNDEIAATQSLLALYHSVPDFNWSSNHHLSALLYGGTISERKRIPNGVFKSGAKLGDQRFKIEVVEHHLPRMYKPLRGSETAKEGVWSVDEDTLGKLKGGKRALIDGILTIKKKQKLVDTYLEGVPKLHDKMNFEDGIIHGQLNQCVAVTGRLSATKPNTQNISGAALEIFISRYG